MRSYSESDTTQKRRRKNTRMRHGISKSMPVQKERPRCEFEMVAIHEKYRINGDGQTDRKCGMDAPVENSVSRVGLSVPMRCDPEDTQNQEQKQHPELNGHAKKDGVSNRQNRRVVSGERMSEQRRSSG